MVAYRRMHLQGLIWPVKVKGKIAVIVKYQQKWHNFENNKSTELFLNGSSSII